MAGQLSWYCKLGNFRENFIFANGVKRHIFATKAYITYISQHHTDLAISRGVYFHETSHMRSFANIKPSQKFPNVQYNVSM